MHKGSRIHVAGAGKFANGTISREPEPGASHIAYRSEYNLGERLVPISKVQVREEWDR